MRRKKEHDFSVTAFRVVQEATGQLKGGFDAKAMGRRGGLKGGKARAASLAPERRVEIAKRAARARWGISLYNETKATQVAGLLMKLNGGEMDYAKCIKLMYNIEREALNRWMRPVTFDGLYSLPHGQVVSKTLDKGKLKNQGIKSFWRDHIETYDKNNIRLIKECGQDKLSRVEVELINEFSLKYKEKTAGQMMDEHHNHALFPEWKKPHGSSTKTTYPDLLRILGKTEAQIEEFKADMNELTYLEEMKQ